MLLRHGESLWNKENLFSGWTYIDLPEKGVIEAHRAGQWLKSEGLIFDVSFTSVLKRSHVMDYSGRFGSDVDSCASLLATE